jgi:hypothetical protein
MTLASLPDIVLDVANAANPQRAAAAAKRLASDGGPAFAPAVAQPQQPVETRATQTAPQSPYAQFERFILQTFIDAMLPKDGAAFGKGFAGGVWKSFMADAVAGQMAKGESLGLASALGAKEHE